MVRRPSRRFLAILILLSIACIATDVLDYRPGSIEKMERAGHPGPKVRELRPNDDEHAAYVAEKKMKEASFQSASHRPLTQGT